MSKTVSCDSCKQLMQFDSDVESTENALGGCSNCGADIGLHSGSTYYRCPCGRGLVGVSKSQISEGTWVQCSVCETEFSIIPQSSRSDIYSCLKCGDKSFVSFEQGNFECECGKTIFVSLEDAKLGKICQCQSCGMTWSDTELLWKLPCNCGFIDSARKLPNQILLSTPGKVGLSASAIERWGAVAQGSASQTPTRVDQWLDKAFIAGDPVSMVTNFIIETAEIGAEALRDSRQRKFESADEEVLRRANASVAGEALRMLDQRLGIDSTEYVTCLVSAAMVTGPFGEKLPAFYHPGIVKFFELDANVRVRRPPIWWVLGAFADPISGPVPVIFLIEKEDASAQARVCALVWASAKNRERESFLTFVGALGLSGEEVVRLPGISLLIQEDQVASGVFFSSIYSTEKLVRTLALSVEQNAVADIYLSTAPSWPYTVDYSGMSPFGTGLAGRAIW